MYLLKALESPVARYQLKGQSFSCLVAENRLFVSGGYTLHVFKVKASSNEPLEFVTKIIMSSYPQKIARIGSELVLGIDDGTLSLLDIESCEITHSHKFK